MSEELKPCPFCGDGMPAIHRIKAQFNLACVYCLCAGPLACSVEEAVAAWNRRDSEAHIDVLKAALEPFVGAYHVALSGLSDGVEVRVDASFELQNRDARCVTRPFRLSVGDFHQAAIASSKMKQVVAPNPGEAV